MNDRRDGEAALGVLTAAASAVVSALAALDEWGDPGPRPGQIRADVVADDAAVDVLLNAGFAVLSEESGRHGERGGITVVLDPVDGSTNASRGLDLCAVSLCAFDGDGPLAALVRNLVTGTTYTAVHGGGATRNGSPIGPSQCRVLGDAFVALSGLPGYRLGAASRSLGVASLALCGVADGSFDAFVDLDDDHHHLWDVAGGMLVCAEAGVALADTRGRPIWPSSLSDRRSIVAAGQAELLDSCQRFVDDHRTREADRS